MLKSLGSTDECVVFDGNFTAPELREKVKAFETLFGAQPRLIMVNGLFEDQEHGETAFANYHAFKVLDIGKRGEWFTAEVDGAPCRIKVKADQMSRYKVRLYF